jgi:hypothetical protein
MVKLYKLYLSGEEIDEINKTFDIVYKHREKVTKRAAENRRDREGVKTRVKKPIKAIVFTTDDKIEYVIVNKQNTKYNSNSEGSECSEDTKLK